MEKLAQETLDLTQQNINRIAKLFPSAITETKDADGKLKSAVNFTVLKQLLSDEVVDGDECYEFTWVGKKQSIIEGNRPIRKTLRPAKEESKNWDTTENLYIEGDNLEVLKLLQNSYLNSIKMIYIDPPYNTGNDFVYRDDFAVSREDYEDEMGVYDEDENRLFKNTETNGRFHSDWCSMMYPRLQLARNLLSDDGVIFISIDDNEVDNLRKICDEVFGESNFVANIIWQKKTGASDAKGIATITEYIQIFCKNRSYFEKSFTKNKDSYDFNRYKYSDKYNETRGNYYIDNLDRGGLQYSDSLNYPIECPDGTFTYPNGRKNFINDGWIWKWSKKKIEWAIDNDFLEFRKSKNKESGWSVCYKNYLNVDNENNPIKRAAPHKNLINDILNANAATGMKELFKTNNYFNYSKPKELIEKLISFINLNNEIILDFFSGSATTAHAVIQLNAEDDGNRKFIMVQLPELTDEKSEAYKAGYKNICEIGKERIRRAGKKIEEEIQAKSTKGELFENEEVVKTLDTGFRVLKLDSTNMKDVYYSAGDYSQQLLLDLESNIKDDRTDLDLLYGVLLDWGVSLSLPHISETIDGKKVHFVNETDLVACFEEEVNEDIVREIAKRKPLRVVFRDSCFSSSPEKINVSEIFKTLSPDTTIKVI
jgi:adenine-specific DNA-methyltransferase